MAYNSNGESKDNRGSGEETSVPTAASKIFIYMLQYKYKIPILFSQKEVYRFATGRLYRRERTDKILVCSGDNATTAAG